jgi:hypothetical protein
MEKFFLKTKKGEVITHTKQKDEILAIEYFSKMKKLNKKDLIKIFNIEKG